MELSNTTKKDCVVVETRFTPMPPMILKGEYGLRPYAGRSPAGRPEAALCGAEGAAARPSAGLGRALGRGIQRASRVVRGLRPRV